MNTRRFLSTALGMLRSLLHQDLKEGLAQNTLIVLIGHGFRLALGLISSALLARGLGPEGLSAFSVVSAALMVGVTVGDCGLSNSIIRQISGDLLEAPGRARQMAGAYARLKLIGGAVMVGCTLAFTAPLTNLLNLPEPSGPRLIWIAAAGLLGMAIGGIVATILQALRRFRALVITQTLNIGLTILLMGGLFAVGQLTAASALLVGAATTVAAAVLGWFLLPWDWRAALLSPGQRWVQETRRILDFSKWLWVSAILSILSAQLDLLLLNRMAAPQIAGLYALALNVALKASIINQTLHLVLLPVASALSTRESYVSYARRSLSRSLVVAVPLVLVLPLARPFILAVYGGDYAASVNVFYFLMVAVIFDLLTTPILLLAFPMNMPRLIAVSDGVRAGVLLLTGTLFISILGMHGAALAKIVAKVAGALVVAAAIAVRLRTLPKAADAPPPNRDTSPYPLQPGAR